MNLLSKVTDKLFSPLCYQVLLGMLGAMMIMLLFHLIEPPPPRLATVNISGIVQQFVQSQVKQAVPKELLQQRVKSFGIHLEQTLESLAFSQHVVLVPSEAVIAGAPDLTSVVEAKLQSALAGQNP